MIIKEITIYGYGKIHNKTFSDLKELQVFFGENEAGKSTLMSFIHSILFGFPLKSQSEKRYEPKDYSAYGGRITVESRLAGEVIIQRVKGKAAGDVSIIYSDGRKGTEQDLKILLQGIDKTTFQNIYSFDLNGLNGLSEVNEKDISRYLLSTGLVGSDSLLQTEQRLQKRMDQLFKPSGKLPVINEGLKELQHAYERVAQAGKEQDRYKEWQETLASLEQEQVQMEENLKTIQQRIISSYNFKSAEPLLIEESRISDKLSLLGNISFPEGAMDELKLLKGELLPLETSLETVQQQINNVRQQLDKAEVNEELLLEEEKIRQAIDQAPSMQNMTEDMAVLDQKLEENQDEIQQLRDFIHTTLGEEEILQLDTGSSLKERVISIQQEAARLDNDKQHLDQKQAAEQNQLRTIEQRISFLMEQILPEPERDRLQTYTENSQNEQQNEIELQFINQSIESLEKKVQLEKRSDKHKRKTARNLFMAVYALCIILLIVFAVQQNWLLAAIAVIVAVVAYFFQHTIKLPAGAGMLEEELRELYARKEKCMAKQGDSGYAQVYQAKESLQKDDEWRQQLNSEKVKQAEHEQAFHSTVDEFEHWEQGKMKLQADMQTILNGWRLPILHCTPTLLQSLFESISALKQSIYSKRQLDKRKKAAEERMDEYFQLLSGLCQKHIGRQPDSITEGAVLLKQTLRLLEENKIQHRQLADQLKDWQERQQEASARHQALLGQMEQLFQQAGCKDEKTFIELASKSEEAASLQRQLETITIQLKPYADEIPIWKESKEIINDYSIELLKEEKQQLEQRKNQLVQKLSDVRYTIAALEDGGTYDERLFEFQMKKSSLNEDAREWMKISLAKAMLEKTVEEYKKDRFPRILERAVSYTSNITGGEYTALEWDEGSDCLLLQRKDGMIFEAKEVSRGTQEAVYVALRLALARESYKQDPQPIIIDDSFVNLDRRRLERVLAILRDLKKQHQIIFFTCHEYILDYFKQDEVISLIESAV
ncbi:ATP-binding protein [Bacillus testis]|uniref:ATP-binding protein n=1 Tax=Bacillus testis TaxID=1622072 RepID=UPI00067F6E27|nr:AAA family ATPase [Bacillus testis]